MQKGTSSKQTIAFVEKLKRQWMATVDAIVDPLMMIDRNYNIIKANRALEYQSNLPIKKIIGQKCYKIFAGRETPCPGCEMLNTLDQKKPHSFELKHVIGKKYHEVISQPAYDQDDNIEGVIQIYRDRTQEKTLWLQLLQSEKMASIGLLAGGIAHEINNPLGGILIFSQMVLKEMDKDSSHYQDIVEIEAAAQRCKLIVENLLQFARKPGSHLDEKLENVAIAEVIDSALRFGLVGQKHKNYQVVKRIPTRPLYFWGNKNKSTQLFLNLIQNALHAMRKGGTLTVKVTERKGEPQPTLEVQVEDTGAGISKEHLKKIFDPFFTTKDSSEGTGLGLSICHGIVKELKGTIKVKSTEGKGSCFTVSIPLVKSNENKLTA
jgi:signal transduction histidine kinase